MILQTLHGGRAKFTLFDSSVPIPRPSQWGSGFSYSGHRVSHVDAAGLPAFMRGTRLLAETIAMFPIEVCQGYGDEREVAPDAAQNKVLRQPNDRMTAFQAWCWAIASMLRGNAYLWKVKTKRRGVEQLWPLRPDLVTPRYLKDGSLVFDLRDRPLGPVSRTVTSSDLIHIPGILLEDPFVGVSIVGAHRHSLGTFLARQEFEGRYLANDGAPGVVIKTDADLKPDQRQELRDSWEAKHQGPANAGRPAILWGGASIDRIAVSLEDAQFVESQRYSVEEIGRMLGIPGGLLGSPVTPEAKNPEFDNLKFLTYGLQPWMVRLEQGLAADRDLFPDDSYCVELDPAVLMRTDVATTLEAAHKARQAGIATANELRPHMPFGLAGDHQDGDVLLATPVGGAPNLPSNPDLADPGVNP